MTDLAPKLGGLVEFYRSPARVAWTPTGTNVPDYPKLAQLWWKNVAQAVTGEMTPQKAMDTLADEMDDVMARLERAGMAKLRTEAQQAKEDPATSGSPTRVRRGRSSRTRSRRARPSPTRPCWTPGRLARCVEVCGPACPPGVLAGPQWSESPLAQPEFGRVW